jgi:hypothetical protein
MSKKQKRTDYPLNSTRRKAPAPAAAHASESHGDHHGDVGHQAGHDHQGHQGGSHTKDDHSNH